MSVSAQLALALATYMPCMPYPCPDVHHAHTRKNAIVCFFLIYRALVLFLQLHVELFRPF